MRIINEPSISQWAELCKRPAIENADMEAIVTPILEAVINNGDEALKSFSLKFDKVTLHDLAISEAEIDAALKLVPSALKESIEIAYDNIYQFHKSQEVASKPIETMPGVVCWRKSIPIDKIGLYIPGGSAPLFSTVLMLGIPAQIAGSKEIILCTPPNKNGEIHPAILYAANRVGISKIYKVGGAQAIAAMAFGTETIPATYKIFGPGNQYVTAAKQAVSQKGIAIDMPAGPSEVLVIADKSANAEFVAADLLSQAEHGADSQAVLVATDVDLINEVKEELAKQLALLPRKEIAEKALKNSFAIYFKEINEVIAFSNKYAPEHLIMAVEDAELHANTITNAGSVFIGNYTPEAAGDYASGTNHTLPTNGYATAYSGVSLDAFVKKVTFQKIDKKGLINIGNAIEVMAEAEELMAHKNAVTVRLNAITKNKN